MHDCYRLSMNKGTALDSEYPYVAQTLKCENKTYTDF